MSNQQMFQPEEQRQRDPYADRYERLPGNISADPYGQSQIQRGPQEQREQPLEGSYRPTYQTGYSGEPMYGPGAPNMEGEKIQPRAETKSKKKGGWGWIIPLIIILVLLGGGGGMMDRGSFNGQSPFSRSVAVPINPIAVSAAPTISVINTLGDIKIRSGNSNTVQVNATKRVSGFNGDVNDLSVKTNYDSATNTVFIAVGGERGEGFFNWQDVELEIVMPSTGNIDIKGSSSDIDINAINGKITLTSTSGDIKINNSTLESSLIETVSGDVTLKDTLLKGNTNITSISGEIDFQGALDPASNTVLKTTSSEIDVRLPENASFELKTNTISGDIDNDFGSPVVGSAPNATLEVSTTSGEINIRQD